MKAPFTVEQFLEVFEKYNTGVWPVQIFLYLVAFAAIILAITGYRKSGRIIPALLSVLWIWAGLVYHIMYFTSINKAAFAFGGLFLMQGILFLLPVFMNKIEFKARNDFYTYIGAFFMLYALLIYPLLNEFFGHGYPQNPSFGLPCPLSIFTFGLLLWTGKKLPIYLLLIPFLWSIVGSSAALNFGIYEDVMLIIASLSTITLILIKNRKYSITT